MPVIVIVFAAWAALMGYMFHADAEYTKDVIKFEQRCTGKGGLTLSAYKTGVKWVGCYKDGKELENEQ